MSRYLTEEPRIKQDTPNLRINLVFLCVTHILDCKPRQQVCEYKTCVFVFPELFF